MSEVARVTVEVRDSVAWVYFNRPDKHNGLDLPMFDAMIGAARKIRKDRSVRAVILAGKGPSFCAGLDFASMTKRPVNIAKILLKPPFTRMNKAQNIAHCWRDLPIPVIAAIHGNCFGGGLQIALATDYRIARPDANLSIMEMKWGIIPDMSIMVTLSRLTRVDVAQELIMTGRPFSAQEGYEFGLISKLSDNPWEEAERLARLVAEKSPDAVAASKSLIRKAWKKDATAALFWERWTQAKLLGRENQRIAMKNGLSKNEPPRPFRDRTSFP